MPVNFKSYEAQTRLLAAVIASNPGLKLDYKVIARHFSASQTATALEHRFRKVKDLAKRQQQCVAEGKDPENLEVEKGNSGTPSKTQSPAVPRSTKKTAVPKKVQDDSDDGSHGEEIQKYFGESTAGGIEWQFRDIKKLTKAQKDAVAKGESPANLPEISAKNTPSRPRTTPLGSFKTPGSRNSKKSTAGTPASGRGKGKALGATPCSVKRSHSLSEDSDGDVDYSELDMDETPSRRKSKHPRPNATPSATPSTSSFTANSSSRRVSTQDDDTTPRPTTKATPKSSFTSVNGRSSIFGNGPGALDTEQDTVDLTTDTPVYIKSSPAVTDPFGDDSAGAGSRATTNKDPDVPSSVLPQQDLPQFPMDDEMYDGEA